jgi:hypothetical protein
MDQMTDEQKVEFGAKISNAASKIVTELMANKDDLGPLDSAFALGAAAKLVAGVASKLGGVPLETMIGEVQQAFMTGFEVTQADVSIVKAH